MTALRVTALVTLACAAACTSSSGSGGKSDAGVAHDAAPDVVADAAGDAPGDADAGCAPTVTFPYIDPMQYNDGIDLLSVADRVWYAASTLSGAAYGSFGSGTPTQYTSKSFSYPQLHRAGGQTRLTWVDTQGAEIALLGDDGSMQGTPSAVPIDPPDAGAGAGIVALTDDTLYVTFGGNQAMLQAIPMTTDFHAAGPATVVETEGWYPRVVEGEGHRAVVWIIDGLPNKPSAVHAIIDGGPIIDVTPSGLGTLRSVGGRRTAAVPGGFVLVLHQAASASATPPETLVWYDWTGAVQKSLDLPDGDHWFVVSSGSHLFRAKSKNNVITYCVGDATSGDATCDTVTPIINHTLWFGDAARLGNGWVFAYDDYGVGRMRFVCDP